MPVGEDLLIHLEKQVDFLDMAEEIEDSIWILRGNRELLT